MRGSAIVVVAMLMLGGCSEEDRIAEYKKAAAEKQKIADEEAKTRATYVPEGDKIGGLACDIAAEQMIDRMNACDLSMDGISPRMLCARFTPNQLRFWRSRRCDEMKVMIAAGIRE